MSLLLALRLALSQAFITARTCRSHFVVLDEPFKMMDIDRTLTALCALRQLSPQLTQFLAIQPRYTEEQRECFDCLIATSLETPVLDVDVGMSH